MVKISDDNIQTMARLSGIAVSEDEASSLNQDIQNILSYVEQLGSLDTEGVAPTYQALPLSNRWRDDTVDEGAVPADTLLDAAPGGAQQRQIKVPKVL